MKLQNTSCKHVYTNMFTQGMLIKYKAYAKQKRKLMNKLIVHEKKKQIRRGGQGKEDWKEHKAKDATDIQLYIYPAKYSS